MMEGQIGWEEVIWLLRLSDKLCEFGATESVLNVQRCSNITLMFTLNNTYFLSWILLSFQNKILETRYGWMTKSAFCSSEDPSSIYSNYFSRLQTTYNLALEGPMPSSDLSRHISTYMAFINTFTYTCRNTFLKFIILKIFRMLTLNELIHLPCESSWHFL